MLILDKVEVWTQTAPAVMIGLVGRRSMAVKNGIIKNGIFSKLDQRTNI